MVATFVFQGGGGGGGDAWIKLFNQSSSNTNVSACKTLNLRTFLMVDKHSQSLTLYDLVYRWVSMFTFSRR